MSSPTRWTVAFVAVAAVVIAALFVQLRVSTPPNATDPVTGIGPHPQIDAGPAIRASLTRARELAGLPPCPQGPVGAGPVRLRGVEVGCAADGARVDAGRVLAGPHVVVNLWAYWCVPCRAELPAMAEYQRRAGSKARVVTVHQDDNEAAAVALLAQLGVALPTLQDGGRQVAAALRVPNVMPATVVLAPDGSVARILAKAFTDADEITSAIEGGKP